ncbi:hypothetical protein GOODEAATRI_028751 [Goodea atripinnis]|uniref:CCHC-type domain-containing protein n=1 Tax=Goodea atripinnis TaxID=208336 RepID=A0ABV0PHU7_9TELE
MWPAPLISPTLHLNMLWLDNWETRYVTWSQGEVKSPHIPMAPTIVYQLPPPIQWESYDPRGRASGGLFGNRAGGRAGSGGVGSSPCLVCGEMNHWARSCPQRYGARPEGAPLPLHQPLVQQAPFPAQPPNPTFIPPQGCQYPVQGGDSSDTPYREFWIMGKWQNPLFEWKLRDECCHFLWILEPLFPL